MFTVDEDGLGGESFYRDVFQVIGLDLEGQSTATIQIPQVGAYWETEGGYFGGLVRRSDGRIQALIVSRRQGGDSQNAVFVQPTLHVPNMTSMSDGQKNFEALLVWAGYSPNASMYSSKNAPAFNGVLDTLAIQNGKFDRANYVQSYPNGFDGKSDWRIPAIYELELLFRNFKPTAEANAVGVGSFDGVTWGENPIMYPTSGSAHTATMPGKTTVPAFAEGGSEAFGTNNKSYMSSSEYYDGTGSYGTGTHIYTMLFSNSNIGVYGVDPKSDGAAIRFVRYVTVG
jgi:hypothetical protein